MSTYPQYGTIRRDKVRLQVVKGYTPTDASKKGKNAPVAEGKTIISGQVMVLVAGKFQPALQANLVERGNVYFSEKDSNEFDNVASGVLEGYPSDDDFRFQTAFIDAPAAPITVGTLLTVSDTNEGNLMVAAADDLVVGRVSGTGATTNGLIDLRGVNSTAKDAGLLVVEFETGDSNFKAPTP